MKTAIITSLLIIMFTFSGCSGGFSEGAATGAIVTGTLAGLQQEYQTQEEELIARQAAALAEIENATTDIEKAAAQAKLIALEKKLQQNEETMLLLKTSEQAVKTDWSNPESVSNFLTPAAMMAIAYYFRKNRAR